MTLTVGSLFSGIGGLELGLERAGMKVVWQVEKDDFCRKVLAKHWPDVPKYEDVKNVGKENLAPVDLICGGFPCQDISASGKGAGIDDGERSGLWREFVRLLRELRPRYAVVENVGALAFRGLGRVLGDLAESGYDARWESISAGALGAPHRRDRLFILADADIKRRGSPPLRLNPLRQSKRGSPTPFRMAELPESPICRVDDVIPRRVDRLRALGNAVVPQVAELIGRWIVEADSQVAA